MGALLAGTASLSSAGPVWSRGCDTWEPDVRPMTKVFVPSHDSGPDLEARAAAHGRRYTDTNPWTMPITATTEVAATMATSTFSTVVKTGLWFSTRAHTNSAVPTR